VPQQTLAELLPPCDVYGQGQLDLVLPSSAASSGTLATSDAWFSIGVFLPGCGVASAPGATSSFRCFFSCWTFLSWAMLRGSVIV